MYYMNLFDSDETGEEPHPRFDKFLSLKKRLEFPVRDSHDISLNKSAEYPAKEDHTGESVLARYVERFRTGAPMSRQERLKQAGSRGRDFWWLSGRHSVGPYKISSKTRTTDSIFKVRNIIEKILLMSPHIRGRKLATHLSSRLPGDEETRRLQERADRLLEQSYESSEVSTDPVVSTEGLGSSPSAMSVATDRSQGSEERVYRPSFTRMARESTRATLPPALLGNPQRPEDDILYQWRLKRKMELAKVSAYMAPSPKPASKLLDIDSKLSEFRQMLSEYPQPSVSSVTRTPGPSAVHFTPAPGPPRCSSPEAHSTGVLHHLESAVSLSETREVTEPAREPIIASPTLHRKGKVKVKPGAPEPHLHLMCDLLPCPHQELTVQLGEGPDIMYTQYLQAERPDSDQKKISDRFRSQGDEQSQGTKQLHSYDDKRMYRTQKQCDRQSVESEHSGGDKKSKQASGPDRLSDERTLECDVNDDRDGSARNKLSHCNKTARKQMTCNDEKSDSKDVRREATPPQQRHAGSACVSSQHPVDSAIGQVVSGYLFDPCQSGVGSSVESLSELTGVKGTAEKTSIKQMDDSVGSSSDGEDFPEDAILQQLRQQRSLYEKQLREIDELLSEVDMTSQEFG
ncbi:uncharacterized protein LOC135465710 [Liolophura sinensis]|uniref:uncharacterized protein LOC135465710 n=1 Tax=Liolophura sinensis TaxID=3198878 RepID=UPI003157FA73